MELVSSKVVKAIFSFCIVRVVVVILSESRGYQWDKIFFLKIRFCVISNAFEV